MEVLGRKLDFLVLYLSFGFHYFFLSNRSLNLEQEAQGKQLEKDKERASLTGITTTTVPAEPSIYKCFITHKYRFYKNILLYIK